VIITASNIRIVLPSISLFSSDAVAPEKFAVSAPETNHEVVDRDGRRR
jgi:hypothetical protein